MSSIVRVQPQQYVHVLDLNTNITSLEVGPKTLILQDNHKLVREATPFIAVPPGYYCIIKNPVKPSADNTSSHYELKYGHIEYRFHKEPFPLYPGEILEDKSGVPVDDSQYYHMAIYPLVKVNRHCALRLEALCDVTIDGVERKSGDIWQEEGPFTYINRPEVIVKKYINPICIDAGSGVKVEAIQDFVDKNGRKRVTGEEWIVREPEFLEGVYERVLSIESPLRLGPNTALHLTAEVDCVDGLGRKRTVGEEWIVTMEDAGEYLPEIGEKLLSIEDKIILTSSEYCIVLHPVDKDGKNQLGKKELRKGVQDFFLQPGESLESGIQKAYILGADEALVLTATDTLEDEADGKTFQRVPGEKWMIFGPRDYIPPIEVKVVMQRKAIPLNKNEGVYVRDTQSGKVRAVMGPQSYMLQAYEELWEKILTEEVERILRYGGGYGEGDIRKLAYFESSIDPDFSGDKPRNKTKVIVYKCPSNSAVQVYNYNKKQARVIFGPDLVILGPQENFNILSLSAGKPKKADAMQSIVLMLGPDFITDIIEVETSDHARLRIKYGMNNCFKVERGDPKSEQAIFSVPDFIGFACSNVASRIRGSVSQIPFDEFHKYSSSIIRKAVFGVDKKGKIAPVLMFDVNNLMITNVDVQSIEPVDINMRESLSLSVQMAIEISTKSIEKSAEHEAKRVEQMAKGQLERQKLVNKQASEAARKALYELRAITASVESTGKSKSIAKASAEKMLIESQSEIDEATLKSQAKEIEKTAELECKLQKRKADLEYRKMKNELEVEKARRLAQIEVNKFSSLVDTLGQETLAGIAQCGPEFQEKMLTSLGIKNVLFTDGNNFLNLLST